MPPGRRWHFQVHGKEIHLIRAGEEAVSLCGLKYGAIKDITTVKDKKYAGDRNQMILVRILWCMYPSISVYSDEALANGCACISHCCLVDNKIKG